MYASELLFGGKAESGPVVGSDLLVILDYLLRVTAVENELHDRTLLRRTRSGSARQFDKSIVNTGDRSETLAKAPRLDSQMRSPRWLPVVCGEENFMLSVDYKILVVAHNIGNPGIIGECIRRLARVEHVQRDDS